MRVKSFGPELGKSAAAVNAPKRQYIFGARLTPKHARLLAPGTDNGLAARFDDSGTDEKAFATKSAILHTRDIADEVPQFFFDSLGLRLAGGLLAQLSNELLDLVIEQPLGPASESGFVVGMLFAAQERHEHFARVFQRMIEVHDLSGRGKTEPSHIGQALGPIDEQDHLHQALDLPATDLNATGFGQMLLRLLIAGFIGPFQAHEPGQGRRVTALQPQSRIGRIMALLFAFVIVVIPCQREGTEQAVNPGAGSSLVMLAWLGLVSRVELVGGIL